jgi:peptide/nickel transport system permease protein
MRPWQRNNRSAARLTGVAIAGAWIVLALLAPLIAPHSEAEITGSRAFAAAGQMALLGTDNLGRDVLSRVLFGARLTLGLAAVSTTLAFIGGVLLGGLAGLSRGIVDTLVSRAVDALMSFPAIMLALIIITGLGTALPILVGTVALVEGTRVFRLARALTMDVSVSEYVEVARLQGESTVWIVWKEILPNIYEPLAADLGLRFTYSILFISTLSFLGLGVQPPSADWGGMVRENMSGLLIGSLAPIVPAAAIASVTMAVTLAIDSLQATAVTVDA